MLFVVLLWRFSFKGVFYTLIINIIIGAVTLLTYSPIFWFNGWQSLVNNNGITIRNDTYIQDNIWPNLRSVFSFFCGNAPISFKWVVIIFIGAVMSFFKRKISSICVGLIVVLMILSPFAIIQLHHTIPFERVWIYLMVPLCLGLGLFVESFYLCLKKYISIGFNATKQKTLLFSAILVGYGFFNLARVKLKHRQSNDIDYVAKAYSNELKLKFPMIKSIGILNEGMAFYLAEDFNFECSKANEGNLIQIQSINPSLIPQNDILVFDKMHLINNSLLSDYLLVDLKNNYFKVFVKKQPY